jgi:hypothetical protein
MSIERRKAKRIEKDLFIQYQESGDAKSWDMAQVKDISQTGLAFKTDKTFEPNTILHLRIKLPSNPFIWHEFDGRVVECGKYQVRIEIQKIDSAGKNMLQEYIEWNINKQRPPQDKGAV